MFSQKEIPHPQKSGVRNDSCRTRVRRQKILNPYSSNINHLGVDIKISNGFSISADYVISKGYNSSFLMHNNSAFNFQSFPNNNGFLNSW